MRVLIVNRPDAETRYGGDTVQMHETARELRRLGVEVDEKLGPQTPDTYAQYDVIHLFNLQTPGFTQPEAEKAKAAGKKIAISTIYWDFGAELLLAESPKWGKIAKLLGRSTGLKLAQHWAEAGAETRRIGGGRRSRPSGPYSGTGRCLASEQPA